MPKTVGKREQIDNVNFVRAVEKHPCLYNYTLEEYTKREYTDTAWEEVADAYDDTVKNCKLKWKNLRTVFVKNLRQRANGLSTIAPYYLNTVMQFLVPYVKVQNQTSFETPSHLLSSSAGAQLEDCDVYIKNERDDFLGTTDDDEIVSTEAAKLLECQQSDSIKPVSHAKLATERNESSSIISENSIHKFKRKINPEDDLHPENARGKRKKFISEPAPDNYRKMFLLSLLPEVEAMSAQQFRLFRRNVLDAIDSALEDN